MRKKIILTIFIIMILIQSIVPIKVKGFSENRDVISYSVQINKFQSEGASVEENEMTGLDVRAGILIEPTVEFFTFVLDSIMSVFSGVMSQQPIQFVMVEQEEKDKLPDYDGVNIVKPFPIDVELYRSAKGYLTHLKFPRFTYSPEEIFSGEIGLLDVNFIEESNSDGNWLQIRTVVAKWYKILRMVAIVGLLPVLIYIGIKIILSSNTNDKAKYKQMILNWFIAVFLAFFMHYIMAFILAVVEEFLELINGVTTVIEVCGTEGIAFKTNLMGLARFQMQQQHFSGKIGHLIIYTALVVFTFKFTLVYLKRVLRMAFLTVISPIVAITYPIDKMDGEAKGFKMWIREYTFNVILQPLHALLYYILVTTSLTLAANNPIYGIAALMFMAEAEKILKKIFGFDKARAGTVGGISGAFATGAVVTMLTNYVKDPMHPLGIGKGKGKSSGNKSSDSSSKGGGSSIEDWVPFKEDTTEFEDLFPVLGIEPSYQNTQTQDDRNNGGNGQEVENPNLPENAVIPSLEKFFARYRKSIPISINESGEFYIDGDASYSIEDVLRMLAHYPQNSPNSMNIPGFGNLSYDELKNVLLNRIDANEFQFLENNILPQYIDGDRRSSRELMEEIIKLYRLEEFPANKLEREYKKLLKKLKLRMAQNDYIVQNGGVLGLREQESARLESLKSSASQHEGTGTYSGTNRLEIPSNTQRPQEVEEKTEEKTKTSIEQIPQHNKDEKVEQQEQEAETNKETTIAEQKVKKQGNKPIRKSTEKELARDERKLKREQAWENFKGKQVLNGVKNVAVQTGKTIVKPVWDTEKGLDWKYNGKRLAGNILKGVGGVTVGIAAATVQAGISITDGKYKPVEGVATFAAGMAGVSKLAKTAEQLREERNKDKQTLEKYSEQWFNRDDVISNFNIEYPGEGKTMRRRAVNNYVSRGITDFKDQKQGMKYADVLMRERGLNQEEADKLAIATIQYKRNLTRTNSYMILHNEKQRKKYIDTRLDAYSGAASRDSVKRLHDDLIENVRDFDRVNS